MRAREIVSQRVAAIDTLLRSHFVMDAAIGGLARPSQQLDGGTNDERKRYMLHTPPLRGASLTVIMFSRLWFINI